jgi:hypothetical protein
MWSDCRQTVGRSRGLRWFAFTLQPAWRSGREAQSGSCRPPPSRVRRPLLAAASACLRAITARHFKGSILRRARNCRFSSALNVASYARRPRASYRQATRAKTAYTIGTAKGIIADMYHLSGNGAVLPTVRMVPEPIELPLCAAASA